MRRVCIQGSVCGPMFWNLILDELLMSTLPDGCHLQAFADDLLLITCAKNIATLENITQTALKQISEWGSSIKLKFNPNKTQMISFTNKAQKCKIIMENQFISCSRQIKYLGVIIDHKLNFIKHTEYIINKSLNLLHKLIKYIKPTWGINPENVRTIYSAVIEPILCYAASIWNPALKYKYVNKRLLSLQRTIAIKIIRGFRTISTATAISLAQLHPLPDKINIVADLEKTKQQRTSKYLPTDIELESPSKPMDLLHPSKRETIEFTEATCQQEIEQHRKTSASCIFTDGSKNENGVGAAFVILTHEGQNLIKKYKLHNTCSIYQAEIYAIQKAINWIFTSKLHQFTIFSDSKSSLQEIQNPESTNPLIVEIHHSIAKARTQNKIIKFVWIKAHNGVLGNELADTAAKSASNLNKTPDYCKFPISYIKQKHKIDLKTAAEVYYNNPNNCAYLKTWCPTYETLINVLEKFKLSFCVTQVLSNHGFHKKYLYRFKITANDKCPCDSHTQQSVEHLIKDCPKFSQTRIDHEVICNNLNISPYKLIEVIQKESCIESFTKHVEKIVNSLKKFNKD